uniref:Eukaryotic translation initiation factor 3 subunit B n=1 Tax=Compsopogon caeruleus TaxID=31354 RepID=A0A7S1TCY0_9RHOD|mmetsp:Transcript_17013/g.35319  ORF Transcript_17013/g.35319 Transcript_17013/m.35319 type:complete len:680 (+) Transcript_17013:65-2104(+)|eukprot:CAMPEP_0184682136 /NCGR_PEP_ID=MMETSP0312-20130426/5962_1 /TAXON_ID=31354 /ORGANISM="Compsopogon coeruleus, Strain SAG 36.94" /LENGTH=679 /DNA_ID=CAMNT_0027133541 /DNA_START=45 /DNA_END=2084 /DNA_ORIENTATION=-
MRLSTEEEIAEERRRWHERARHSVVVVDKLPKVNEEKFGRLRDYLVKIIQNVASTRADHDPLTFSMPQGPDGMTYGMAMCTCVSPEDALRLVLQLNGYQFDRAHKLSACTLAEAERVLSLPEIFNPDSIQDRLPQDVSAVPYKKWWLLDPRGRDQYLIRHGDETEIFWFDPVTMSEHNDGRMRWADSYVRWSPRGSYLATFHIQGIALWSGPNWDKFMRFPHENVKNLDFSPCERFLITSNELDPKKDNGKEPTGIVVWEVATGKKLRGFQLLSAESTDWPAFRWSHDGQYFARISKKDFLSIYETPHMGLIDKRSLKIPEVQDFSWSPADNLLAYWTPEVGDTPARVTLIEIPSRQEVRQKALFSVHDIKLDWQADGNFLCCKVDRLTKSKKGKFTNFELFRVRAKDIPVEVLEYKEKDTISAFAWEPNGYRFAIIHAEGPSSSYDVSLYSMEGLSGQLKLLTTLTKRTASDIFWSPQGGFLVLAGLGQLNGALEWYNVNELESWGSGEHFLCTDVEWDPSGRFFASSVSCQRNGMDSGFKIWSIHGKELEHTGKEKLYEIHWRPRPKSLLSADQVKEVKRDLKIKRVAYEKEDDDLRETKRSGIAALRKQMRDEFRAYEAERLELYAADEQMRMKALGITHVVEEFVDIVEETEEILDVKQEVDRAKRMIDSDDDRD